MEGDEWRKAQVMDTVAHLGPVGTGVPSRISGEPQTSREVNLHMQNLGSWSRMRKGEQVFYTWPLLRKVFLKTVPLEARRTRQAADCIDTSEM